MAKEKTAEKTLALKDLLKKSGISFSETQLHEIEDTFMFDLPSLYKVFGGKLRMGRLIQLFGKESGGKTTLAEHIAGQCQKYAKKPFTMFVDFEHSFDFEHARIAGLDTSPDKFALIKPDTAEEAFTLIAEAIKTNDVGCIIIDSDANIVPSAIADEDAGKVTIGVKARFLSNELPKITTLIAKRGCLVILISQIRTAIGQYSPTGTPTTSTGGNAPKFYSSARFMVSGKRMENTKGDVEGIFMKITNVKNKMGQPFRSVEIPFFYHKGGFDFVSDIVDYLADYGIIERKAAYFYVEGVEKPFQGKKKLVEWLTENPDKLNEFKKRLYEEMDKDRSVAEVLKNVQTEEEADILSEQLIKTEDDDNVVIDEEE